METTLRDMEVDVAMEVARELGSTERMNSQANGSGSWIWERKSENEKSWKLFWKNPGQVNQETIAMEIKFKLKGKLLQWNEEQENQY